MSILIIFIIAVSLSMDAFSLSLAYGTLNLDNKTIKKLSLIVGLYHFIMPLIGLKTGNIILNMIKINPNTVVFIVLLFIGIEMIIETFKQEEINKIITLKELLLFGLAVSIDSLSVGIGLNALTNNNILTVTIFSLTSLTFTYIGLKIGKKINKIIGKISTFIGGIILILVGIMYIL